MYLDVSRDNMFVKIVNNTNNDKDHQWQLQVDDAKGIRQLRERHWAVIDNRKAVDSDEEIPLYFVSSDVSILPNPIALRFHKNACHTWRMAGGAEVEEERCPDDAQDAIAASVRKVEEWSTSVTTQNLEQGISGWEGE
jgi:hypothetical protein